MAVVIPVAVALLFLIPPVDSLSEETRASLYLLPKLNAIFNGTAFCCLIAAFVAIKNKNIRVHRAFTTSALALSVLFLLSYVWRGRLDTIGLLFYSHFAHSAFYGDHSVGALYVRARVGYASGETSKDSPGYLAHLALRHRHGCHRILDDFAILPALKDH